jgi:hypothetical protein
MGSEIIEMFAELMGVSEEKKSESKVKFDKPCLVFSGKKNQKILGYLGTKTNLKDIEGNDLYVGDVVKIEHPLLDSEAFVIEDEDHRFGIMGAMADNVVNGKCGDFIIRKIKSYKDLKHNEYAGAIVNLKAKFFYEE